MEIHNDPIPSPGVQPTPSALKGRAALCYGAGEPQAQRARSTSLLTLSFS